MAFQDVSFAYSGKAEDYLYTHLEFGVDCDSRIALVGPNGAGKSTLLKIIGGITRVVPFTGITLPFISYGGSSLVANYVIIALLLRVSDESRRARRSGREGAA